jgi:hypothetical protein
MKRRTRSRHDDTKRLTPWLRRLGVIFAFVFYWAMPTWCQASVDTETQAPAQSTRTLDAITIEGEIAVPQVLFVTSRDHPRYRDGLRYRYRKAALDLGRNVELPSRLRVDPNAMRNSHR